MTESEKAIAILLMDTSKWWHVEDLINNGKYFVSYKIQARISELALDYPEMIETRKSSKGNRHHMYRFRSDNSLKFLPALPVKMRQFVSDRMKRNNIPVEMMQTVPRFNPDGTVTLVREAVTI